MDERKDFIDTLQTTIRGLQEDGIITSEQLKEKIEVPLEWFYSSGIDRRILSKTFENICEKVNPGYKKATNRNYAINTVKLSEYDGKIRLKIVGRDKWTFFDISDESSHTQGKIQTFSSDEFIEEMNNTIRRDKYGKLRNKFPHLSHEDLQDVMDLLYDSKQQENTTKGLSTSLSEMIENFGEYYRYLYNEKQLTEKEGIKVTSGGLIEQDVDQMSYTRTVAGSGGGSVERVNEIYPFEERDHIFRQLKPMEIISFDSIDGEGQVQRGTYTSYVYANRRENGGYFIISEPYRGDKSCRAVYLSEEQKMHFQEGEENTDFWVDMARAYLEMSCQEFHDEPSTYTFKHRALEPYAARMQYIISGDIDSNVSKSVIYSAKMNLSKLFGIEINKQRLGKIVNEVSKEELDEVRGTLIPQAKEQNVGGIEK